MKTRAFWLALALCVAADAAAAPRGAHVTRFVDASHVILSIDHREIDLRVGESSGGWTLMYTNLAAPAYAVFENFDQRDASILWVDANGVRLELPKALESTAADSRHLLLGHSVAQIRASPTDLLGEEILAKAGDPDYAEVAQVFAPIRRMSAGTYSFVGTPLSIDKVGFTGCIPMTRMPSGNVTV